MSIRVPAERTVSVPPERTLYGSKRYARLMADVLHDKRLGPIARLVYAELALWAVKTDRPSRGQRKIAEDLGFSLSAVSLGIAELIATKHIRKASMGQSRGKYIMLHPSFRESVTGNAGGQVVEHYRSEGVYHKREIVSRERLAS